MCEKCLTNDSFSFWGRRNLEARAPLSLAIGRSSQEPSLLPLDYPSAELPRHDRRSPMRALLLAAFLSSTALVASAGAQTQPTVTPDVIPQGEAQGRASVSECERLADFISESKQSNAGVTADQALAWKQAGNG